MAVTALALLFRKDQNISQKYKKHLQQTLHRSMQLPPAFSTRERDGVYVPEQQTFCDAFYVLSLSLLSSKTKETAFQIWDRTIWTNNKSLSIGAMQLALVLSL